MKKKKDNDKIKSRSKRRAPVVLTSTHDLCLRAKKRKMCIPPVNPSFTLYNCGVRGINHTDMLS